MPYPHLQNVMTCLVETCDLFTPRRGSDLDIICPTFLIPRSENTCRRSVCWQTVKDQRLSGDLKCFYSIYIVSSQALFLFSLLTTILGLVLLFYLNSIHKAICRPSVVRPLAEIRTRDGRN